jgi:hypothetical protein
VVSTARGESSVAVQIEEEMTDKEFFDFCYEQYRRELDQADLLYQRGAVILPIQTFLAGAVVYLTRTDLWKSTFLRLDVFLYYLAALVGLFLLVDAMGHLVAAILPRNYERVASTTQWRDWREGYRSQLAKYDANDDAGNQQALQEQTAAQLLDAVVIAEDANSRLNETRMRFFRAGVLRTALSLVVIVVQAVLYFAIRLRGL